MNRQVLIIGFTFGIMMSIGVVIYACMGNPPIADMSIDRYVCVGCEVSSIACGRDPDVCTGGASDPPICNGCAAYLCGTCESTVLRRGIRHYLWDWDEDGMYEVCLDASCEPIISYHTYYEVGTYAVKLRVWDHDSCAGRGDDKYDECTRLVTAVGVMKLQYNEPGNGWIDICGTLYVHVGTAVTFKAIPNPGDAYWPGNKPVWGGSSGASGTGETTSVVFNTLSSSLTDFKTVTATCGTSTVSINVIVYDFEGVFIPEDYL